MKISVLSFACLLLATASCAPSFEEKVTLAVKQQLVNYPESHLQDLYKNFFQDRFGPGHLIPDTAMAGLWLRNELADTAVARHPLFESIGWEGNFCRVSIDVIKSGLVPYSTYLEAFVESANSTPVPSDADWRAEWADILSVIDGLHLNLPDYEAEKAFLQERMDAAQFVVHHSDAFELAYHPHYRVIRRGELRVKS
jgi:hypothetical protein